MPPVERDGFTLRDLSERSGFSERTLHGYIRSGLLESVGRHGVATRYSETHLARVLAIAKLHPTHPRHAKLAAALDAMTEAQLRAFVGLPALPEPPAVAPAPAPQAPAVDTTAWRTIELLPGLELRVKVPVSGLVERLVLEIVRKYALRPPQE